MIFYRLTDWQARQAATAVVTGLPFIAFLVLKLAGERRENMAVGVAGTMLVLFGLIAVQITQSRRLNRYEGEVDHG